MDYLTWAETVLRHVIQRKTDQPGEFVTIEALRDGLSLPSTAPVMTALYQVVWDLDHLGAIENRGSGSNIRLTDFSRQLRMGATSVQALWPVYTRQWLEPEAEALLDALITASHTEADQFAWFASLTAADLKGPVSSDMAFVDEIVDQLRQHTFLYDEFVEIGIPHVRPSYQGVVRATKAHVTERWLLIQRLVESWETSTVEFKRELPLDTPKQKAEFARDVIALANTKASGGRWLVLGFDDTSHAFHSSVPAELHQERLEQVLSAWTDPVPSIQYSTVESGLGNAATIEIERDATKLPHRMRKGLQHKIQRGDVFVRHGTLVEEPTVGELQNLVAEGVAARVPQ